MRVLVFVLAFLSFSAAAQTAQQISSESPQLVTFAGSDANLQSLVNGLSLGQTVTVVTQGADGLLQIATFTPPAALGSDVSRTLEQARNALIARGIVQPNAQQIAVTLMGGTIATASGPAQVPGVLTGATSSNAVQVRTDFAGGAGTGFAPFGGSVANFQALSNGLRQGTAITLTGAGANGVLQGTSFTPPGGAMSAAEASQLLQLAAQQLAVLGIVNPSPQQIQAALVGGTLNVANGTIALQGVLQGRAVNTSTSNLFGTSNDRIGGPGIAGASSGAGATAPVVGSTPPFVGTDGVRRANTSEGANRGATTGR